MDSKGANDYVPYGSIGYGGFSQIFKVEEVSTGEMFALKQTYLNEQSVETKKNVLNEMKLLKKLLHPNVVKCYESFYYDDTEEYYCGVLELCSSDLYGFMDTYKSDSKFNFFKRIQIVKDIANGLEYIHSQGIVHRDLKPENILIGKNGEAKITDFNLARKIFKYEYLTNFCGTPMYIAPEIYEKKMYRNKVDLWSLGMVIYELFENINPLEFCYDVQKKKFNYKMLKFRTIECEFVLKFELKNVSAVLYEKIKRIVQDYLSYDPNERKTAIECIRILEDQY